MARLGIVVVIIAIALMCTYAQEKLYDDKFDDLDVIAILNNERLREQYYKCFMEQAPCVTEDTKFFKSIHLSNI